MKLIIILISTLFISQVSYSQNSVCSKLTEDIPVQAGGRVKPLYVLAKESIKFLTGKSSLQGEDPTLTFCKIMTIKDYDLPLLVEHVDTKKFLGIGDAGTMPSSELLMKKDLIRAEVFKQKENNSYKKDLSKLFQRISTFEKIQNQEAFTLYQKDTDGNLSWIPLSSISKEDIPTAIQKSKKLYIETSGDKHLLELTYAKSHIFSIALLISLVAVFLTVLLKNLKAAVGVAILSVLIQTVGMAMRVMISGRAPITNMYETVMFSGYGALLIALVILIFRKEKIFLLAGLGHNILCLFMMMFANNMLSSSISPLVPVLRDNFWLSTHVTTIILSYAALALSWMVANITLFKLFRKSLTKKDYRYHQDLIYTCIKVGIILLSAGIILGGVWADYSWGRFWGWDPKETWSLIVLLFYMALVHGKYSTWINTHRFVMASAAGFMTVMMAWFGVNYILASGLHSYGFSEGGAIFLGSFFAIQIAYLIFCGIKVDFKTIEPK